MRLRFYIPGYLRTFTNGQAQVVLDHAAATVGEALEALWRVHPGVRDRVVTEAGTLRPHVNVFLGEDNIRDTGGFQTPVSSDSEVSIVPAVSGGG